MHIPLWEGDRNAFRIKASFNGFGGVKTDTPIIFYFYKRTHYKIYTAVT